MPVSPDRSFPPAAAGAMANEVEAAILWDCQDRTNV
jgi:hypothetical protein